MIVVDTSVVVAFMNRRDGDHERVVEWMESVEEDLAMTPPIVAEIDHLVTRGGGPSAALSFYEVYEDLEAGAYLVEWRPEAMSETVDAARKNHSLGIGISDASLLALAARFATTLVATLDERCFRVVKPLTGEAAFTLLPADA